MPAKPEPEPEPPPPVQATCPWLIAAGGYTINARYMVRTMTLTDTPEDEVDIALIPSEHIRLRGEPARSFLRQLARLVPGHEPASVASTQSVRPRKRPLPGQADG